MFRCLKLIQAQSCRDYEVIIVDDASRDQRIYDKPISALKKNRSTRAVVTELAL